MYGQEMNPYSQMFNPNQYNPAVRLQEIEQQQARMMQAQQPKVEIQFVGGVDGAKSYPMPNGSSVLVMDNTDPLFYTIMTDPSGMRNIKAYQFQEVELKQKQHEQIDTSQFATKDDLKLIMEQLTDLKGAIVG